MITKYEKHNITHRYFVQTEMKLTNEGLRSIFDRIDTNGDGVLQRDEIMNGFQANGITFRAETADAIMSLADKNNDGVIQYEEFEAMMENLWKTHNVVSTLPLFKSESQIHASITNSGSCECGKLVKDLVVYITKVSIPSPLCFVYVIKRGGGGCRRHFSLKSL